jgi:hypothetical protein
VGLEFFVTRLWELDEVPAVRDPANMIQGPPGSGQGSLAYARDQLGHGSIQITVDTCPHWIPRSNRTAADRLALPIRNPDATRDENPDRATEAK